MSDPLALLPLAVAAARGTVDDVDARALVAAGLTLLQRCAPLVRALHRKRSAILLPPSGAYLVALAASEGRGAVLINPLAAPPEIAYQIADADVGAVLTSASLASKVPAHIPRVVLDAAPRQASFIAADGSARTIDLGSHVGIDLEGSEGVAGSDEEAAVVYTSAMAGLPLGARLSHRNLLANARSTVGAMALDGDTHSLAILPFAHLFGLTVTLMAPLLAGGRVRTMERFNPLRALDLLEAGGISFLVGVPAMYAGLLAALQRRAKRFSSASLATCICGGAPLSSELQDRWAETTGVELRQGYGLTEASPVCLYNRPSLPNRRGTLGVPFPDVRVTIRDPSTSAELPAGSEGEICVAGENVFMGYVQRGEVGLQVRSGWLHSGDLGHAGADGWVTFTGLLKDMFTHSGFNIYPRELEQAVSGMPGVRAVRVRAIPDQLRENDIALDVVGAVERDAVRAWCAARLASYKRPAVINVSTP